MALAAAVVPPDDKKRHGFYWNYGGRNDHVKSLRVIVIQAAFGDATLLEVIDVGGGKRYYLIDGGPTTYPGPNKARIKVFENLIEVLLFHTKVLVPSEEIKLDGIMITHPDADHFQGIVKLFRKFPPNKKPQAGMVKFDFKGPLLLTKAFNIDYCEESMKVFDDAHFKIEGGFEPGKSIEGFEKPFNFFYPNSKYPGTLYNYSVPAAGPPPAPRRIYARSRYSIDSSIMNSTSTLLVIEDPNNPGGDPWASLNGDGLGHSILQSLNQKHPKLFKVPHHGSIFNSIPLGDFQPDGTKLIAKLVVVQALLTKAIDNNDNGIKEHILESIKAQYDHIVKKDPPNTKSWNKMAKEMTFDDLFKRLASDFQTELINQGVDTGNLLNIVKKRSETIRNKMKNLKSLDDIKNQKKDFYIKNVEAIPNDFSAAIYKTVKNNVLKVDDIKKIKRLREGYELFFRKLEKDDLTFAEDLAFFLTRAFYNQVCANTYFISSGSLHRHPSWEIINGIIAAAHDYKNDKNANYKCRILLTSGNNLLGKKIKELYKVQADGVTRDPESILLNDWTQYVTIQYFIGEEAYAILNPEETNPNYHLHGTEKWDSNKKDDDLNDLKRKYNKIEGAIALQKKRAIASDNYEIKATKDLWLELVPPQFPGGNVDLRLSASQVEIKIDRIGQPENDAYEKTGVYIKIKLKQIKPPVIVEAYEKPSLNLFQHLIFFVNPIDDTRKYLRADTAAGVLTLEDSISRATYFMFGQLVKPRVASREVYSNKPFPRSGDDDPRTQRIDTISSRSSTESSLTQHIDTISGGTSDGSVVIVIPRESEFRKYLDAFGVTVNISTLTIFDAIILSLQSELNGYFVVNSLAQFVVEKILNLPIDERESTLQYISFSTGPYVRKANIVAQIPASEATIDFGFTRILSLSRLEVVYPDLAPDKIYLSGTAKIGFLSVNVRCPMPEPEELPEIEVILPDNISLNTVISLLGMSSSNTPNFNVPLMTALKDIQITKASVTLKQGIHSLQSFYLSKLALGVSFTSLSSYLPSSFSNLKTINTHVVVYHPKTPPIKISLEVEFMFEIPHPFTKVKATTIPLTARFATRPVDTERGVQTSYDITVSIQANSTSDIDTSVGGISITDFLQVFGLGAAANAANSIPFLNSFLQNVQLKQLVLEMNSSSKTINSFSLKLCIFEWDLLPSKITINQAELNMFYDSGIWQARFNTTASFGTEYQPLDISFVLSNDSFPARFTFTNYDEELTIAKFFEIFGLGSIGDLPIVGKFLSVTVTEAFLEISKTSSGIKVNRGRISLRYDGELVDFGVFTLSQMAATIGLSYNEDQNSYVFGFSVSGFISDKLYISAEYDPNTSVLSGTISISTLKEATLFEVINRLLGMITAENNTVYSKISTSPSVNAHFKLKYNKYFYLTDLEIDLVQVLSLGSFSLDNLRFEFHYIPGDFRAGILSHEQYTVTGFLSINNTKMGAVLEFDVSKDSTSNIVTASIRPTAEDSLTLTSFMNAIGIDVPSVPEVKGQNLPSFFDISLTHGTITFSLPNFTLEAFSLHVETTNEVTLLNSPVVNLSTITLKVDYDKDATPSTTACLLGIFTIGRVQLALQGCKEPNGDTVFRVLAASEEDTTTDLQQSIDKLTPTGTTSPVIPLDIGIPKPLNVLIAELIVKFSPTNNENSVLFTGHTQLDWPIDLGFQEFTIKEVGGKISYKKSTLTQSPPPPPQYEVFITGQFQFSNDVFMSSELHFGEDNVDTVLSVIVGDVTEIEIPSVADDLLGFNDSQDSNNSVQFDSLLPQHTTSFLPNQAFININFTKKVFGLFCKLRQSLGYGFLLAGDFSTNSNTPNYGYTFGISLPEDFKISDLLPPLSAIDTILKVKKANCMVVSINNAKVSDVVAKMKSVQQTAVSNQTINFPFANLTLDTFTNGQDLVPGLSVYCELDFTGFDEGSLFNSIVQISSESNVSSIILSSLVSQDPHKCIFKAHMSNLTLLGTFQFTNVNFIYKPLNETTFELNGNLAVLLGDSHYNCVGKFVCSSTQSVFTTSTDGEKTIAHPLGMVGITLRNVQLSLTYKYPTNKPHSSIQSILGTVNFYSTPSDVLYPYSTPSVVLTGSVIFYNYTPTVVKLVLETDKPLTIADLISTLFIANYDKLNFLNIGFVNGQVYYAKLDNSQSVVIDGVTYKRGYHIVSDIEIFDKMFAIEADIIPDTNEVAVTGYAHGALDLNFAKFTGVKDISNSYEIDDSKSPQVVFRTSPNNTSISLVIGFILLGTKLGVGEIGFKREDGINKFFGKLAINTKNLQFLLNELEVEWSKEHGFKVNKWPISPDNFELPFNFFNKLKTYSDSCHDLTKLIFKEGVKTKFDFNVGLSKTKDPEKFFAQIDITGTYNILLGNVVKIASVEIPDISVGLPKEEDFSLKKLPGFITDLISNNANAIVKQIVDYPDRLAKIVGLTVLKEMTGQIMSTFICRNVDKKKFDPDSEDGEDPTTDDFDNAFSEETEFESDLEIFESLLEAGIEGAVDAAIAAATAEGSADIAAGSFGAIAAGIATFLAVVGLGVLLGLKKKKKKAEDEQKKINEKKQKDIIDKMTALLDIKGNPVTVFQPPSTLTVSWTKLHNNSINYHIVVQGIPIDVNHLGQKTAPPVEIYNDVVNNSSITLHKGEFYNMLGLKVTIRATIHGKSSKSHKVHTYYGPAYTVDVLNVHATLHPPTNLQITYNHYLRQIKLIASPVAYAQTYLFQLIDNNNTLLGLPCSSSSPTTSTQIECQFPHSAIQESSVAPFKVRGQSAVQEYNYSTNYAGIASSVFVTSNSLEIVPPPSDLQFTLPHFVDKSQFENINLQWTLPDATTGIIGFRGQIIDVNSNKELVTADFPQGYLPTPPTSGTFDMNYLMNAVERLNYTYRDIVELIIRINSVSGSQQTIDSVFVSKPVVSLKSPDNVTASFSSGNNTLQISWIYSQQSSCYGVQIRNAVSSNLLWSKKEVIRRDPNIEEGKVGKNYSMNDIPIFNDPEIQYSVQVIAIATGNETFDSFVPSKAPGFLQVLHTPVLYFLIYRNQMLSLFFQSVFNAFVYKVKLRRNNEQKVIFECTVHYQAMIDVPVEQFVDKFNNGDVVKCSIHALGTGLTISGAEATYSTSITFLPQPINVTCTYNVDTDSFVISGTAAPGVQNYILAFYDPENQDKTVTRNITVTGNSINYSFAAYVLKETVHSWKFYIKSMLTYENSTQLPSPKMYLDQEFTLLNIPQFESLQYSNNILKLIIAEPIENADYYRADISIMDEESMIIKQFSKRLSMSQGTELTFDMTDDVPNWESIVNGDNFKEIRVSMVAVGSSYYMTSTYSQQRSITRIRAPSFFSCHYFPSEDVLKVTLLNSGIPSGTTIKVAVSSVEGNKEIAREITPTSFQENLVTFTGKEIRIQEVKEWKVYGQTLGAMPSQKIVYSKSYKILDSPKILSVAYDVNTTEISVTLSPIGNNNCYKLVVGYETSDGEKHTVSTEGYGITGYVDMKSMASNWGDVTDTSKLSLTLTAVARENSDYINSKPSADYDIESKFTFFTSSSETTLSLKWDREYDNRNVLVATDMILYKAVQDAKYTDVPKRLFLYPKVNPDPAIKSRVYVIVDDETKENHYRTMKQTTVQAQEIIETDILGYNSGGSGQFDDGLSAFGSTIIGIKSIEINYNEESVTRIRATYCLSNRSQYIGPSHGRYSSNQVTIELEDKESVIAVSANTSQSRGLSKLTIVTQKANGSYTKYGPYGAALVLNDSPIRFSGNVISFKGRTDSGGLKNLGFHYTFITPTIQCSATFGGGTGGIPFEHNILTYAPPVSHVRAITLKYDGHSMVSIQPDYQLVDNSISHSYPEGGHGYGYNFTIHRVNVVFEENEMLIGLSGKSFYDDRVPGNVISSLKLTTQKSDGTLNEHGPYGKPEDAEGGNSFIMRGRIHGFFGKAGWIINTLGVYYSLERSEIFGGPGGVEFEDVNRTTPIARLKKLHVRYNNFYIRGIYGTYILSDNSTWVGPKHGTSTNIYTPGVPLTTLKTIEFADDEDIVSMIVGRQKTRSVEEFSIGYIELITQTKDGKLREYPRIYNTYQPNSNFRSEIEFKGRIISLMGRSSTNNVNALGVVYIPIPDLNTPITCPEIKSPKFGANYSGVGFNHKTSMSSYSSVARVKSLRIQYDSLSLVSITPVYEFENGKTYRPPTQGGLGFSQTVTTTDIIFDYGELLLSIKGWYAYDSRASDTVVTQFSAITQKSDGNIKTYGPYGKSDGGTRYETWGKIVGFYGRSGSIVNQIGVYSSLMRTDLIGSNEGKRFSDDHWFFMIVGIKTLKIKHSHKIHSIQATYRTSGGLKWEAPVRGTDTFGTLETLEFEEDEDIVSIKVTMSGYVIGGLEITTQRRDGSNRMTYPRVGTESEGRDFEIKGRVVTLIGRSQYNVNAIGAKYIPLPNDND